MKILFVDQTAELGGAELSLFDEVTRMPHSCSVVLFEDGPLRRMLAAAGVPVEVISAPSGALRIRREAGLRKIAGSIPGVLQILRRLVRHARGNDVIFANSQKAFVIGALAAALTGRPLVWRLHDVLDASHFSPALRRIAVILANWKAERVIVNSAASRDAFAAVGGDASRVSLAYPGIDEAPFDAVPAAVIADIRAQLGPPGAVLVGVFGRLSAWKGQQVFVDAIAQLPEITGVIVGGPLFGEEAYAAALHRKVAAAGLAGRIRFLGFRRDVAALMCSMDVIVHSSVSPEPFGRVVVEGMLAGRPVIASAAGGVPEIITHGETGWLYEPGNAQALAATLRTVLHDKARAASVAEAGRARACGKFTIDVAVGQICDALRDL